MNDLTRYYKFRPLMQSGDGLLYRGDGVIATMIAACSKGFSHVGMISRLEQHEYMEDRIWTIEAVAPYVRLTRLSNVLAGYNGEVWWLPLKPSYEKYREKLEGWALAREGTKYDFGSIVKSICGRVSADLAELYCSELLFMDFRELGLIPWKEKSDRPGDIPAWQTWLPAVKILSNT